MEHMEHWWNDADRGNRKPLTGKPVPVQDCPPQISQVLAWGRTMAWPCLYFLPFSNMVNLQCVPHRKHRRRHFFNKTIARNTKVHSAKYYSDDTALDLRGSYSVARTREIKKGFLSKTADWQ